MSRLNVLLIFTLLVLTFVPGEILGMRAEPVTTSLLSLSPKIKLNESQLCLLENLKKLTTSIGRIPPRISRKKIVESIGICIKSLKNFEHPTIVEETIYMTLGQYGYLSQIDVSKSLEFVNEIQKDIKTTVNSYTRIYRLSQDNEFCRLFEDFLLAAYPKEYHVSFLPENSERCLKLLNRVRQNSFYSYWNHGGVVADQAQPIVDDKVSDDPVKTKDIVINNVFQAEEKEERVEEKYPVIPETKKPESEIVKEDLVLSKLERELIELEEEETGRGSCSCSSKKKTKKSKYEEDEFKEQELEEEMNKEKSGSCGSCSSSKKKKSKDGEKAVEESLTDEELELKKLEDELANEESGCCGSCSSKKKDKKTKKSKDEDELGELELKEEILEEKSESRGSCSSSKKKNKDEGKKAKAVEESLTDEELELKKLEDELANEESGCCGSCSSKKKKESKKGNAEKKPLSEEEELRRLEEELGEEKSGCCSSSGKKQKKPKHQEGEDELLKIS
ncbi:hypothetical protein HWI79_869 [Cryptosporidium felis]|nr:hypothetical protein HWI79_869 [Cryptosporidium felis]